MGAGVHEDDSTLRRGGDGIEHSFEVETFCGGRKVGVRFYGEGDVGEYLVVVGPGGGGEHDGLVGGAWVEAGEEETAEVDGASAGDRLECRYLRGV